MTPQERRGLAQSAEVRRLVAEDFGDVLALYQELMGELPVLQGAAGQQRFQMILDHPGTVMQGAVVHKEAVAQVRINDDGDGAGQPDNADDDRGDVAGTGPERVVSVATLHVHQNLTHGGRPYALIENVVTAQSWQHLGLARRVMRSLQDLAWQQDAYKIMLLTGKTADALGFYQSLGYRGDEKHGLVLRRGPLRRSR